MTVPDDGNTNDGQVTSHHRKSETHDNRSKMSPPNFNNGGEENRLDERSSGVALIKVQMQSGSYLSALVRQAP